MIKAVLLDLDDTLLHTDTRQFGANYLKGLAAKYLLRYPDPANTERLTDSLRWVMQIVLTNLDPTRTNSQIFNELMPEQLNLPEADWRALIDDYHATDYQRLVQGVKAVEAAQPLVQRLLDMQLAVVVATNPVFSLDAVMQRLAWAGLDKLPFTLVTNADDMHFTKPNPHYYEEILARIGVEADEAIMIGDDVKNDIAPAARAGLNTFWIEGNGISDAQVHADGKGSLADFAALVAQDWLATLETLPRTVEQIIPRMIGDTGALYGLVNLVKPSYWHMRPDPNEWSPLEIICHLRDSERTVQRPRLQKIASEDNPFVSQPTAPPGPGERDMSGEDGQTALRDFWRERCDTITFLERLAPEDWQRPARHSIFGPTTLLEMALFTTRHDHLHINQLCQTIGRCQAQ